jgi:hypothetical protein
LGRHFLYIIYLGLGNLLSRLSANIYLLLGFKVTLSESRLQSPQWLVLKEMVSREYERTKKSWSGIRRGNYL